MDGAIAVTIDYQKAQQDARWDGIKGYLTNSTLKKTDILENYRHFWQIEKAFRIAKKELKIRPFYHYKQRRIEAHIYLNFVAYKVCKKLGRQLKEKQSDLSPEKDMEIIQNIHEVSVLTPDNELITKTIIRTGKQRQVVPLAVEETIIGAVAARKPGKSAAVRGSRIEGLTQAPSGTQRTGCFHGSACN